VECWEYGTEERSWALELNSEFYIWGGGGRLHYHETLIIFGELRVV